MKYEITAKHQIHRKLKKHVPHGVHKAKRLVAFKYPKLILLVFFIILAYYLFTKPFMSDWIIKLNNVGYLGIFLAGIGYVFGFFTPFSIGFFVISNLNNLFLAAIIGGLGAMIGDLIIFKTIKFSFMDEFKKLERTKVIRKIEGIIKNNKHILIKHYFLYIFAGIVLVTPLPDEVGVSMLAGLTTINQKKLAVISFILHSISIFLILYFI